jgi:hypothetical protein
MIFLIVNKKSVFILTKGVAMKDRDKKEVKTECIKCWKKVKVTFNPSVKKINCLEVECCKSKKRRRLCKKN